MRILAAHCDCIDDGNDFVVLIKYIINSLWLPNGSGTSCWRIGCTAIAEDCQPFQVRFEKESIFSVNPNLITYIILFCVDFSAVGLPELIKFLQYLFDLVTKTTKSKDATSDGLEILIINFL